MSKSTSPLPQTRIELGTASYSETQPVGPVRCTLCGTIQDGSELQRDPGFITRPVWVCMKPRNAYGRTVPCGGTCEPHSARETDRQTKSAIDKEN